MSAPPDLVRVARFIEDEAKRLREFVAMLGAEQDLLVRGDIDALLALAERKTDLYHRLQRVHDDRALLLARMGFDNSDSAIRDLCRSAPAALARWDEVLDLAREAKRLNTTNGKLIADRLQNNQAALGVLLAAADRPQLYGADGHARASGGGRHLGSA